VQTTDICYRKPSNLKNSTKFPNWTTDILYLTKKSDIPMMT